MTEKSATLIDNIFVNNPSFKYLSGNITTSVSAHLPQFIILENFKESNLQREWINTIHRDFRYFNIVSFKRNLQEINIDLGFETFFRLFNKTLKRHAPVKESTRKEEKIKFKPWITKGIRNSISIRDNLYKERMKERDVLTKILKHESFKKYRNQIIHILRVVNNCRVIWIGINEIICPKNKKKLNSGTSLIDEGKTITNPINIAEIGTNIQTRKHYTH